MHVKNGYDVSNVTKPQKDQHIELCKDDDNKEETRENVFAKENLEDVFNTADEVSCKWVFALKRDRRGNVERHKARLVATVRNSLYGDLPMVGELMYPAITTRPDILHSITK